MNITFIYFELSTSPIVTVRCSARIGRNLKISSVFHVSLIVVYLFFCVFREIFIQTCIPLYTHIGLCIPMYTPVVYSVYPHMPMYAPVYPYIPNL